MTEPRADYMTATQPISGVATVAFDVTPAERNLIMRLRQARGLAIVDSDSMCLWVAGKMEQCNGKQRAAELPYPMDFAGH